MDGLPDSEYHFSTSRKIGFLLVLGFLVMLPFTLTLVQQRQPSEQYSASKCIIRPSCLDIGPTCTLPQPLDGWCPPSGVPQSPTPTLLVTPASSPSGIPKFTGEACGDCLKHNQKYLCSNERTNKQFCFAVPINAPGYSCNACPR